MADVPHWIRHTLWRIGAGLSLVAVMTTAACIATDRTLAPPDADANVATDVAGAPEVADTDVTLTPETDVVADDGETVEVEVGCMGPAECPQAAPNSCRVATCLEGGTCGFKNADDATPCDDGIPCRSDDACQAGACTPGPTVAPEQTPCDDGDACNGPERCNLDGACALSATPACTEDGPDLFCVAKYCVPKGMVPVPDGTFLMGCEPETAPNENCAANTKPQINVFLSAFAIDRTEVPESAFTACVGAAKCTPRAEDVQGPADSSRPATPLRFGQAKELCTFLGKRLCRETEWEKAARGGVGTRIYPWGDATPTCNHANFQSTEGAPGGPRSCSDDTNYGTVPVDSGDLGASPVGAVNMLGNVREWVADPYDEAIYEAWYEEALRLANGNSAALRWIENPALPDGDGAPVVRGLGWKDRARDLRLDFRGSETADTISDDLGVRCCADLAPLSVMSRP